MKKFFISFFTIATFIVGALTFYYQFIYKPKTIIEIKCIDITELTKIPDISGLSAKFYFADSLQVHNLWRVKYLLLNKGDNSIIGQGDKSSLLASGLKLDFADKGTVVLDMDISNQSIDAIIRRDSLFFKQWKVGEYVEIICFIESTEIPTLHIDDRDILDSNITYTEYEPQEKTKEQHLIEYFPPSLSNILKWMVTILMGLVIIVSIPSAFKNGRQLSGGLQISLYVIALIIIYAISLTPFLWIF
jgi:hypothetical protein